jgi:hypothetical protein
MLSPRLPIDVTKVASSTYLSEINQALIIRLYWVQHALEALLQTVGLIF